MSTARVCSSVGGDLRYKEEKKVGIECQIHQSSKDD